MDQDELRARIRELIATGVLPGVLPAAQKIEPGQTPRVTQIAVGTYPHERCLVCEELGPQVSYTYADEKLVRLHVACDALWKQEGRR
jgi:hypothetical protein